MKSPTSISLQASAKLAVGCPASVTAIRGKFNSDVFDKACIESDSWVARYKRQSVDPVAEDLVHRYSVKEIIEAELALNGTSNIRRTPLKLACLASTAPIRLTLYLMAIQRHYGEGGEPVNIASGLPPKPPAPGHWGGRTPGYEQPLPRELFDKNLEAGEPRP